MDSTPEDYLVLKPTFFIHPKLLILLCFLVVVGSGCGSRVQLSPVADAETDERERIQTDSSLAYVRLMDEAVDVPMEKIRQNLTQAAVLEEDSPFGACREEELVGLTSCIMTEPERYEDPLIEADCADSASAWCNPSHEANFLSYLEQQKSPEIQASITPYFIPPVENGLILRGMQVPSKKGRRGHYGIDVIPTGWEREGVPLQAVDDGTVVISSWGRGYGYYVVLYHQNGLFSLYSHTLKSSRVKVGQEINRGDTIAYMGKSGNARGYHVHFELIDLRESWNFEESIDEFVRQIAAGRTLTACDCGQFQKLLFAKKTKQDPLQYIAGLSLAKREAGKWTAGELIVPSAEANLAKTQ